MVDLGQADLMKGPLDWISVLEWVAAMGMNFRARWLGGGLERAVTAERVDRAGLSAKVELPGFISDRAAMLAEMQEAHAFLCCHETPESPTDSLRRWHRADRC